MADDDEDEGASLENVTVEPERWTFMYETQTEAASRGLVTMLANLRREAELLGADFISLAKERNRQLARVNNRPTAATGLPPKSPARMR